MVNSNHLVREEAEKKLKELIRGDISTAYASKWAESIYFSDDNKQIIDSSPSLSDLFDSLIMSSLTHDGEGPMYDTESFAQWLKDYEQAYEEEKDL